MILSNFSMMAFLYSILRLRAALSGLHSTSASRAMTAEIAPATSPALNIVSNGSTSPQLSSRRAYLSLTHAVPSPILMHSHPFRAVAMCGYRSPSRAMVTTP